MFLVSKFLTIKHWKAKILILKIYHVKFQARTHDDSFEDKSVNFVIVASNFSTKKHQRLSTNLKK